MEKQEINMKTTQKILDAIGISPQLKLTRKTTAEQHVSSILEGLSGRGMAAKYSVNPTTISKGNKKLGLEGRLTRRKLLKLVGLDYCAMCDNEVKEEDMAATAYCKECDSEKNKEYRQNNKEKIAEYAKEYYQNTKESKKEYYQNNKEAIAEQHKEYNQRPEVIEHKKEYLQRPEVKKRKRANSAKRRAAELNRTPPWSDLLAIQEFYDYCPKGYHVDHIIPLQGDKVSGLHILENLQYLTAEENLSKGNKFLTQ